MLSLALADQHAAWIDLAVNQWTQLASAERLLPRLVKETCGNLVRQLAFEAGGLAKEDFFTQLEQTVHIEEAASLTKRELRHLWRQFALAPQPLRRRMSGFRRWMSFWRSMWTGWSPLPTWRSICI